MNVKKQVYQELEQIVPAHCLFFTNTSGLSITEMAAITKRPDRFIGTHFFNPVPVMKLLEIIRGYETSDETLAIASEWGKKIGKDVIVVKEAPAFVVNRILCSMINEAFFVLGEGLASAEDRGMVWAATIRWSTTVRPDQQRTCSGSSRDCTENWIRRPAPLLGSSFAPAASA